MSTPQLAQNRPRFGVVGQVRPAAPIVPSAKPGVPRKTLVFAWTRIKR